MSRITLIVALTAVMTLVSSAAFGGTMQYNGEAFSSSLKIHAHGYMADGMQVNAGQMDVLYEGTQYLGYCVDLNQYVGSGEVTPVSVQTLNHGSQIAYLFNTYADTVNSDTSAAGLAVAIWEVLTETGDTFNVSSGQFSITGNSAVAAAATTLLGSIPSHYTPASWPTVLHSNCLQDMVIGLAIPEPATMSILGLGLLGMLRRRR